MRRLPTALLLLVPLACGDDGTAADTDAATSGETDTAATMTDGTTDSDTSDPTTDTSTGPTNTTTPTTTGDPTTDGTTSDPDCMVHNDCQDAALPLCADGICVDCSDYAGDQAGQDAGCVELDTSLGVCLMGECVECTPASAAACAADGNTPVCDNNECRGCAWHSECTDTACHLDGPDVGSCFAAGEVVDVGNTAALEGVFDGLSTGDDVVARLTGTMYLGLDVTFNTDAEVAIIGDGSEEFTGSVPNGLIDTAGSSILYVDGVTIGPNATADGLTCSGTSVWLDNSEVSGNAAVGLDLSGGCAGHLRKTIVLSNDGGGVTLAGGATTLTAENSSISGNSNGAGRGLTVTDGQVDITYSVIVRNDAATNDSVSCSGASGEIRNSVIAGRDPDSISCAGVTFANSSVDTAGLGASNLNQDIANEDTWFTDFFNGNYHLSALGQTDLEDIAMWMDGDPVEDVDDEPRPTDMPSFPGYDEP